VEWRECGALVEQHSTARPCRCGGAYQGMKTSPAVDIQKTRAKKRRVESVKGACRSKLGRDWGGGRGWVEESMVVDVRTGYAWTLYHSSSCTVSSSWGLPRSLRLVGLRSYCSGLEKLPENCIELFLRAECIEESSIYVLVRFIPLSRIGAHIDGYTRSMANNTIRPSPGSSRARNRRCIYAPYIPTHICTCPVYFARRRIVSSSYCYAPVLSLLAHLLIHCSIFHKPSSVALLPPSRRSSRLPPTLQKSGALTSSPTRPRCFTRRCARTVPG
jgi:hypothetical protein